MLTDDPKRLKFLGIDLHSRTRRRVTVILAYTLYLVAIAAIQAFFEDKQPSLNSLISLPGGWLEGSLIIVLSISFSFGIFRENGPVKSFDETKGPFNIVYGGKLILETRDDWARYFYDESFDTLSADKKEDVRRRQRPGRYVAPYKHSFAPGLPDERELAEANRASRRALNILALLLAITAGKYASRLGTHLHSDDIFVNFWQLTFAAVTLPKAVILWREPDPNQFVEPEEISEREIAH